MENVHSFTKEQLEKIYEFLKWIHSCKEPKSNCQIENLQLYKDKDNCFYASYYLHGYERGEPVAKAEYMKIDKDGEKSNLNLTYASQVALSNKFETLEKITF